MSTSEVENLLNELVEKCQKGNYIYRGTPKHHDKVSSSLYRKHKDIFTDNFSPVHVEAEIVNGARRHFPDSTSNIEILTDLRHFGAKTTLIDFSHSIHVALFFACSGEEGKDKDGELILLSTENIKPSTEINYSKPEELQDSIIEPAITQQSQKRVVFQSGVFVHAPKGFIEEKILSTCIIKKEVKQSLLSYLRKFHNISNDTIYNDLLGFITNEENYQTAETEFYRGSSAQKERKYKEAIRYYSKSIELKADGISTYYNRGNAKLDLDEYEAAIEDYNKAIELKPDYAEAYCNRGNAKYHLGQYDAVIAAIKDYDKAIELKPNSARSYSNRGNAKSDLKQYEAAIKDYEKAIEIDSEWKSQLRPMIEALQTKITNNTDE